MILEGFKLTILGMSVVFVFLVTLVFIIKLNSKLCAKSTSRELDALNKETEVPRPSSDGKLVAVISAAIKKFKTK